MGIFSQFIIRPQLRQHEEDHRHATWLELFFDLVLVAAITQVGHLLVKVNSIYDVLIYFGLFWMIFWVWCGHTIYSTRFDTDDPIFRVLTFLNMFTLIVMAIEVHNAAHGHGEIFGVAFLSSRVILLVLLARAHRHVPNIRAITKVYLIGFFLGALIFSTSYLFHGKQVYLIWAIALFIEAWIPWIIWKMPHVTRHISVEHISERFGLFTIIVLGEGVIALVSGLVNIEWASNSIITAALSFIIIATIWWIYFRHIERAAGSIQLGSGQPYIYSHFPLLVGIVSVGIGILRLLSESDSNIASDITLYILVGGYALWLIGGISLHFITRPKEACSKIAMTRNIAILLSLGGIGYYCIGKSPLLIASLMCATSLLYAIWDGVARNQKSA